MVLAVLAAVAALAAPALAAAADPPRYRAYYDVFDRGAAVGGLGMTQSGHLWVATNQKLFRYPASTLDRGAEGRTVDSDRTPADAVAPRSSSASISHPSPS